MPRRYRIVAHLGAGAFGEVLRAVADDPPGREVALKLIAPGAESEDVARRLRDEAAMLRLLAHPAIVRVERLVRFGAHQAVVLEYVPGIDLSAAVTSGGMPARAALAVVAEVADALDAAWHAVDPATGDALRVVHRDIKPANVRLTPAGVVRVIDFGSARAEFAAREAQTRSATFGSWDYMAPERFEGVDSPAGDVFALGLVALELLTGRESRETPKLERRFREWLDARVGDLRAAHAPVVDLLSRMAAFDAPHRPSAAEVRDLARALAADLPGPTLAAWAAEHVPALAAAPERRDGRSRVGEVLVETPDAPAPVRRRRWGLPVAAFGAASVLAAAWYGASAPALVPPAGRVLALDGRSGFVRVPGTPALELGGSATIEAWAWVGAWYRDDLFPVVDRVWRLEITRRFLTFNNGKGYPSLAAIGLPLRRWHHVAAAYDADARTATWYVDGERRLEEAFVQPWVAPAAQPADLAIGAGPFGAPEFAEGYLDEVRIWARALSAEEIGRPLAGRPGLVGAWSFDEADGPVRDGSGRGHDGALVGDARRVPAETVP